jgi:hypothetical protein
MLKKIAFIFIAGLLISNSLPAQDTAKIVIPKRVANKMLGMFPQTQVVPVTWSKEGDNYKGILTIMEKPATAVFDSTGKVIRVERRLHYSFLPKTIVAQLNKKYPENEILDVYELTDSKGNKTYKTTYKCIQTSVFNTEGAIVK